MTDRELENRLITSGTLDQVLGFEFLEMGPELARASVPVEDRVCQPFGLVHGGTYAALAETLVSGATHMAVSQEGSFAVGQSNHTTFLRPVTAGTVHAEAARAAPRAHHLGLGRGLHRRRRQALRDRPRDDGRARAALTRGPTSARGDAARAPARPCSRSRW